MTYKFKNSGNDSTHLEVEKIDGMIEISVHFPAPTDDTTEDFETVCLPEKEAEELVFALIKCLNQK